MYELVEIICTNLIKINTIKIDPPDADGYYLFGDNIFYSKESLKCFIKGKLYRRISRDYVNLLTAAGVDNLSTYELRIKITRAVSNLDRTTKPDQIGQPKLCREQVVSCIAGTVLGYVTKQMAAQQNVN